MFVEILGLNDASLHSATAASWGGFTHLSAGDSYDLGELAGNKTFSYPNGVVPRRPPKLYTLHPTPQTLHPTH